MGLQSQILIVPLLKIHMKVPQPQSLRNNLMVLRTHIVLQQTLIVPQPKILTAVRQTLPQCMCLKVPSLPQWNIPLVPPQFHPIAPVSIAIVPRFKKLGGYKSSYRAFKLSLLSEKERLIEFLSSPHTEVPEVSVT